MHENAQVIKVVLMQFCPRCKRQVPAKEQPRYYKAEWHAPQAVLGPLCKLPTSLRGKALKTFFAFILYSAVAWLSYL